MELRTSQDASATNTLTCTVDLAGSLADRILISNPGAALFSGLRFQIRYGDNAAQKVSVTRHSSYAESLQIAPLETSRERPVRVGV